MRSAATLLGVLWAVWAALAQAQSDPELEPPSVAPSSPLPPMLRILVPQDGATFRQTAVTIRVAVRVPEGQRVRRVLALLGDKPLARSEKSEELQRGFTVISAWADSSLQNGERAYSLAMTLPNEDVELSLRAELDGDITLSAKLRMRWAGTLKEPLIPPKLYVLAIGVSQYQIPDYTLRYPAKDANDMTHLFQQQRGRLYRDVLSRLLLDKQATKAAVLDGLEWLQRQTTSHDVAVLFMAGHGIIDPATGRYYYLPHDADPEAIKRSMVSQDDVQSSVRAIAGKVLVFLDSCHSGKVLGPDSTRAATSLDGLIGELLSAGNGVVVFTASMGHQQARESPRWGNGAFTKAVLEGLQGRAALVTGRPVTVSMLDLYISERVKRLTAGTQTPTTAKPSTLPDFPVALPADSQVGGAGFLPAALDEDAPLPRGQPLHKKWWLWTLIAGTTAGAIAIGVAVGLTMQERLPVLEPMPLK